MAIPFLNAQTEDRDTRIGALVAVGLITLGLLSISVLGAIYGTSGNVLIQGFFAVLIAGAELLAAIAVVRFFLAGSRLRSVVIGVVFIATAWVCVQNVKRGVHIIMPDTFAEDARALQEKAALYETEAAGFRGAAEAALSGSAAELESVRKQIADLKVEQRKMAAQSPEGIREAQALLLAQGKYFGRVDGIREDLTEAAMRGRGEEIQNELAVLAAREQGLLAGAATPVQSAATARSMDRIEAEAKARKARMGAIWLEIMLWALEGARSFGLWAFVSAASGRRLSTLRDMEDEIARQKLQNELDALRRSANDTPKEKDVTDGTDKPPAEPRQDEPEIAPDDPQQAEPEPLPVAAAPGTEAEPAAPTPAGDAEVDPNAQARSDRGRKGAEAREAYARAAALANDIILLPAFFEGRDPDTWDPQVKFADVNDEPVTGMEEASA